MATTLSINDLPYEELTQLKLNLRKEIEPEIRRELKEINDVELAKFKDAMRIENDKTIHEAIVKFEEEERKKRKPLTPEELKILLNQEYVEFPVTLWIEGNKRDFVIREVPGDVEDKFYKIAKNTLSRMLQEYGGMNLKVAAGEDILDKVVGLMDLYEPVQKALAECCAICLDPFAKDNEINSEWVTGNISNGRVLNILLAQVEANKMRDFFSRLFQGFSGNVIDQAGVQN